MWFFTACLNGARAVALGKTNREKKFMLTQNKKRHCKLLIGGVRSFFCQQASTGLEIASAEVSVVWGAEERKNKSFSCFAFRSSAS